MGNIISNQAYSFAICFVCGVIIGIFFDIFRILRKSFKTPDLITYIEDLIFGIITGIFLVFVLFVLNNGQLRFYIFFGLILGIIIYLITISKLFIKINVAVIVAIKKTIFKIISIILYPFSKILGFIKNIISKLILRPFRILTINIKKIFKPKIIKNIKEHKKQKIKNNNDTDTNIPRKLLTKCNKK